MKYLGWILLLVVLAAGIVFYSTKYTPLQGKLDAQRRETEMWIRQTEEMKRKTSLDETRQRMAPEVSLLLEGIFPSPDSFVLTKYGRDTLSGLANQLRSTRGQITVSVFTDDSLITLYTKARYPDAFSYSAAKGVAVIRYLMSQGIPLQRLLLVAHATGAEREGGMPDVGGLSSRRVEIRVRTGQ